MRLQWVLSLVLLFVARANAAEQENVEYALPFRVVMYAEKDAKELKPYAEDVARMVDTRIVQSSTVNPVCCVWLELTGTPNPGKPGYVILHQGGGTVIQASDADQMQLALKRWKASAKEAKEGLAFPIGLMTSFKVVE